MEPELSDTLNSPLHSSVVLKATTLMRCGFAVSLYVIIVSLFIIEPLPNDIAVYATREISIPNFNSFLYDYYLVAFFDITYKIESKIPPRITNVTPSVDGLQ